MIVVSSPQPSCPEALAAFVAPMLGQVAWSVRHGHGSFLNLEFGQPTLEIEADSSAEKRRRRTASVKGEWHLWIYCCQWRAIQDGSEVAWSESPDYDIRRATATLNGQKLIGVSSAPDQGRSTFEFDLGGVLDTWPVGGDPSEEQWMILTDTRVFAYRADGAYSFGPADTPYGEHIWLPLR